jgi:hypothetical protein
MTDPEREHFVQRIRDLERSRARWRIACLTLLGVLLLPVGLGGLLGIAWAPRLEFERARLRVEQALYQAEMERAREEELRARLMAEEALQQAELEKARAEEDEARQQGRGTNKE